MKAVDRTVRQETGYIAAWVLVFSILMQAVFLICRAWDWRVLTGNLLGATAAIGNFFLMGLTVQKAVGQEEKQARLTMKASQSGRLIMMGVFAGVGAAVPVFNLWASLLPMLFPRIAIALRPLFDKRFGTVSSPVSSPADEDDDDDDDI